MPDKARSFRRYERTSGRIAVDYWIDGHPRSDSVVSVSAGGVFVETKDPQPPGTRIRLRFRIPDQDEPLDVDGRVAWTNAIDNPSDLQTPPGMAIQFDAPLNIVKLAMLISSVV